MFRAERLLRGRDLGIIYALSKPLQLPGRLKNESNNGRLGHSGSRDRDKEAWCPNVRLVMHGAHVWDVITRFVDAVVAETSKVLSY